MMQRFVVFLLLFFSIEVHAQGIDVQHYQFNIDLSDTSDVIKGKAVITIKFIQKTDRFYLDLALFSGGTGMVVQKIAMDNHPDAAINLEQDTRHIDNQKLYISLPQKVKKDEEKTFTIWYEGQPKDGLYISKNKFGERTFFADNWPNRAHNWIPCNDRPDDKATFEFVVTAPAHYSVISNGLKTEEKNLGNNVKLTHWKEDVPLSTKVMVIGVAKFAVKQYESNNLHIPVSAWIYPKDSAKGFYDYGVAPGILTFFSNYIAPYPYNKLANVQSTTMFGGMENATAIFYSEESVTGNRKWEDVLAHEIAHQWFGDMASEKSFAHLWLSEGFATYLTDLYIENKYGKDSANKRLKSEREKVIHFAPLTNRSVVDSTDDLMSLLNANSYQKGGWILHMLRQEVGDTMFRKIIQTYYQQYKGANANTNDFEAVAEKVSGKNMTWFFDQWFYKPGIPQVKVNASAEKGLLMITVKQLQNLTYKFPLEIQVIDNKGRSRKFKEVISAQEEVFKHSFDGRIKKIILDPDCKLLFQEEK